MWASWLLAILGWGQVDLAETNKNGNENECGNENEKGRQDCTLYSIGQRSYM